jgi:hypothetical protein
LEILNLKRKKEKEEIETVSLTETVINLNLNSTSMNNWRIVTVQVDQSSSRSFQYFLDHPNWPEEATITLIRKISGEKKT